MGVGFVLSGDVSYAFGVVDSFFVMLAILSVEENSII